MSFILNLETATKNCSVAVAENGVTIVLHEYAGENYSHAEKLHVFIEKALAEANITYKDLTAIAVSMGPGSYTGLRIGVSAAKGLCYALNIPLIAVDTLEALANRLNITEGVIIPMLDARRMEVYSAVFDVNHNKVRDTKAEVITEESFNDIESPMYLLGDGAEKCRELLNSDKFIYNPELLYPSAGEMSALSYNKYKKSDTVDVAYFEPFYLKDFIVNRKVS